ncbi:MAG TPA: hypothetical protein VLR49_16150 [Ferruginibacter sp.]|nr:hypothetical protein [Ferruginibacter sp.]
MIKPLIVAVAVLLLLPNIPGIHLAATPALYNGKEKFSPQLSFINSIDKLEKFVDAAATSKNISFQSLEYAELLDNTIAFRFYESYSCKTLQQDWITVLTDKFTGTHLSSLISPNDILKHPNAAAVQQNIIMMEILKRKNLAFRNIYIDGQKAMEIQIAGSWYFFNVGKEPALKGYERISGNQGIYARNLKGYYGPAIQNDPTTLPQQMLSVKRGSINASPLTSLSLLQNITAILSKTAWAFCLLLLWVVRKRAFKMYAIRPKGKYIYMYPAQPVFNA